MIQRLVRQNAKTIDTQKSINYCIFKEKQGKL